MRPSTPTSAPLPSHLLRRFATLEAAWRQVRANGEQSESAEIRAEVQEFSANATTRLKSIQSRLSRGSFRFAPAKGIALKRPGKSPRPIVIAPIESRIVQRAILTILQEVPEVSRALKKGHNFGGVPGPGFGVRGAIDAALGALTKSGYYIRTDIKSFYVSVPRDKALDQILAHVVDERFQTTVREAAKVELENATRLGIDIALFPLGDTGVAQGSSLSPLLCNYLLRDFDALMNDRGVLCIRYVDDFIVFARNKNSAFAAFKNGLDHLKSLGLSAYDPTKPSDAEKAEHGLTSSTIHFLGCELTSTKVRPEKEKWRSLLASVDEIF